MQCLSGRLSRGCKWTVRFEPGRVSDCCTQMNGKTHQLAVGSPFLEEHLCELVLDLVIARLFFSAHWRVLVRHRRCAARRRLRR